MIIYLDAILLLGILIQYEYIIPKTYQIISRLHCNKPLSHK